MKTVKKNLTLSLFAAFAVVFSGCQSTGSGPKQLDYGESIAPAPQSGKLKDY